MRPAIVARGLRPRRLRGTGRRSRRDTARGATARGAVVGLLVLVVSACATPVQSPAASPGPTLVARASPAIRTPAPTVPPTSPIPAPATPAPTATPVPAITPGPTSSASCASMVLASLTEPQRIGQLFMVGLADDRLDATARDAIAAHHLGSWWFTKRSSAGVAAIRDVSDLVQAQVGDAATGGIGFFIAANQEGGLIQSLSGPGFDRIPSALTQGTWSTATLRTRAARWGRQLTAAGVNLDFAPVADVVPKGTADANAPIGQLEREYGSDPSSVARHVAAFIQGMAGVGVVTTAKHFPGLGRVAENTDTSSGVVDTVTTPDDSYLEPFRRAIRGRVPAVMVSLATYLQIDPGRIAAYSSRIIGGLLEHDLGFAGLVMSDSLSAEAVASSAAGTRAIRFLESGGDMIVVRPVGAAVAMAEVIATRAGRGDGFRRRIDDAALHVLRAKEAAGLLPCGG